MYFTEYNQLRAKSIVLMNTINRTFIILFSRLRTQQLTTSPFVEGRKGSLGEISLRTSKDSTSTSTPPDQTSILPWRLIVTIPVCIEELRSFSGRALTTPLAMTTVSVRRDSMRLAHFPESHVSWTVPEWSPKGTNAMSIPSPSNLKFVSLNIRRTYNCLNLFFLVHPQSVTVSPRLLSVSSPQRWLL